MLIYCKFTIKLNKKDYVPTTQDYAYWMNYAQEKGVLVHDYYYEFDSKERLHVHGYLTMPNNFYIKQLCVGGMHVDIHPLDTTDDILGWLNYCTKDHLSDDYVLFHTEELQASKWDYSFIPSEA